MYRTSAQHAALKSVHGSTCEGPVALWRGHLLDVILCLLGGLLLALTRGPPHHSKAGAGCRALRTQLLGACATIEKNQRQLIGCICLRFRLPNMLAESGLLTSQTQRRVCMKSMRMHE